MTLLKFIRLQTLEVDYCLKKTVFSNKKKKRLLYRGLSHLAFNWDFPSILFDISDRHNTYTQTLQISRRGDKTLKVKILNLVNEHNRHFVLQDSRRKCISFR